MIVRTEEFKRALGILTTQGDTVKLCGSLEIITSNTSTHIPINNIPDEPTGFTVRIKGPMYLIAGILALLPDTEFTRIEVYGGYIDITEFRVGGI